MNLCNNNQILEYFQTRIEFLLGHNSNILSLKFVSYISQSITDINIIQIVLQTLIQKLFHCLPSEETLILSFVSRNISKSKLFLEVFVSTESFVYFPKYLYSLSVETVTSVLKIIYNISLANDFIEIICNKEIIFGINIIIHNTYKKNLILCFRILSSLFKYWDNSFLYLSRTKIISILCDFAFDSVYVVKYEACLTLAEMILNTKDKEIIQSLYDNKCISAFIDFVNVIMDEKLDKILNALNMFVDVFPELVNDEFELILENLKIIINEIENPSNEIATILYEKISEKLETQEI